jgi:hypothetical protein
MIVQPKPRIWVPVYGRPARRPIAARGQLVCKFRTAVCDAAGREERTLSRGTNLVLDKCMDEIVNGSGFAISYLGLYTNTQTIKRVLPGGNSVTVDYSAGPSDVVLTAENDFWDAGDPGRTVYIVGWPELLITSFTSATVIHCRARGSVWLPGFTPSSTGPFTDVGVHYTNLGYSQLLEQLANYDSYWDIATYRDTYEPNYNNTVLDTDPNEQWYYKRAWLTGVFGTSKNIKALAWGDSSRHPMGFLNLPGTDAVPAGKRYKVVGQFYVTLTPLDLSAVTLDWGTTIGSHDCDIREERIAILTSGPQLTTPGGAAGVPWYAGHRTTATTLQSILWEGQGGYAELSGEEGSNHDAPTVDSYSNGTFLRTVHVKWGDSYPITAATCLVLRNTTANYRRLIIRPTTGTITKPQYYWMQVDFRSHLTRALAN